jgi:cytochrome P450
MHADTAHTAVNTVKLDVGSNEFKQKAHAYCAQWALEPPFYLDSGEPLQVVCGRYDDVDRVFSDAKTFSSEVPRTKGYEQFDKFMGVEFITQMDGDRHNRIRRLLMPAFSVRHIRGLTERIAQLIEDMLDTIEANGGPFDGMQDYGAHLVVEALLTAMVQLTPQQKQIFIDCHAPARKRDCAAAGTGSNLSQPSREARCAVRAGRLPRRRGARVQPAAADGDRTALHRRKQARRGWSHRGRICSDSEPDGYTLLVADPQQWIIPSVYKNLRYDPIRGFAPVATLMLRMFREGITNRPFDFMDGAR